MYGGGLLQPGRQGSNMSLLSLSASEHGHTCKKGGGVTINRKILKRYPFYLNILMQFITESNL